MAAVAVSVLSLVATACSTVIHHAAPVDVTVVHGARHVTVPVASGRSVADAVALAHVDPHDGQVVSARSHRALGPNGRSVQYQLHGRQVPRTRALRSAATIRVVDGTDTVEATKVVRRALPPGGLPNALQYVQFAGRPGVQEVTVGVRSGEAVTRRTVTPAEPAHRATGKVLSLTFDDGPDPSSTPRILAILKAKKVHATFCQVGTQVEANPKLVAQITNAGHQLCNHTQHHVEGLETKPRGTIDAELAQGRAAITDAAGAAPPFYRPPGGSLAPVIYDAAHQHGEVVLYWSIDPRDWKRPAPADLAAAVVQNLKPGGIILLHDGGGNRESTIAALPAIIDFAHALGYTFTAPISLRSQVG